VSAPRPTFRGFTLNRKTRIRAALPVLAALTLGLGTLAPAASAVTHTAISKTALVTDPDSYVNNFIGTTNSGDDFPGADVPFGMVQWSPDTPSRPSGGGYEYDDSSITGFSLTHLSGPGCPAAGDVPILPTVGAVDTSATDAFSHTDESASPGYYSVKTGNGVTTELTTTTRSGMARFTFPSTSQANLIFKLSDSANGDSNTQFNVVSDTEVSGQVTSGDFCGATNSYTVYFDMVFDHPFTTDGTDAVAQTLKAPTTAAGSKNTAEPENKPTLHGAEPKTTSSKAKSAATTVNDGYVTFDASDNQVVQAKVGISYVSAADAVQNRTVENPGWNFDKTQAAAASAWTRQLDQVRIAGGTATQDTVFYTALYHASLHPNVISDVNGQYAGFDGKVHTVDKGHAAVYANYSGWDIYRSQAQLEALIDPQVASDTAESMLDDFAQTGQFPKWSENNGETYVMVGDPADSILADYYAFGARDFSMTTALQDMITEATATSDNRPGMNYLEGTGSLGYLPADGTYGCCNFYGPVSTQLEYSAADYSIASLAKSLGDTADYTKFATLANDWTTVFNPASGFMQPRLASGAWVPGFNSASGNDFVEGTSAQYTGMVNSNIAGLAAADGGDADYNSELSRQRALRLPRRHRRPGRLHQRAEPRAALGVRLHRRAVPDPGDDPADPEPDLDRRARRHRGQRRPRRDERLVRLVRAGPVPGDPGHLDPGAGQPDVHEGGRQPAERQDPDDRRQRSRGRGAVRAVGEVGEHGVERRLRPDHRADQRRHALLQPRHHPGHQLGQPADRRPAVRPHG
jgi:predicted alpha-1,2-mannosidase